LTLPIIKQSTCAICGHQQESYSLLSSNTDGHSDLDLRPPEMLRSSMHYWVQECQQCGYCAADIGEDILMEERPLIEHMVDHQIYRKIKQDKRLSELARRFYRQGIILTLFGAYDQAGWAFMHAAWACDDECADRIGADICRTEAYDHFYKCKIGGIPFATQNGYEEEVMVDILRRSGAFDKANALCFEVFNHVYDVKLIEILKFQRELIWMRDGDCYNIGQVLKKSSLNEQRRSAEETENGPSL